MYYPEWQIMAVVLIFLSRQIGLYNTYLPQRELTIKGHICQNALLKKRAEAHLSILCCIKSLVQCFSKTGLPRWLSGKESACNARDVGLIPGSGRSTGGGHGNPLQYSCLENSMDRGAWWATVYGASNSQTQLSNLTTTRASCYNCCSILPTVQQFFHSYITFLKTFSTPDVHSNPVFQFQHMT